MPIIGPNDRKSPKDKLLTATIYLILAMGGMTMLHPFLVMLTGSVSNSFDYERRSALPRYLWSREDRFMRLLCDFFPPTQRNAIAQLRSFFPDFSPNWGTWTQAGDDIEGTDAWAKKQLQRLNNPDELKVIQTKADDYAEFMKTWNLEETVLSYDVRHIAPFLREEYDELTKLNQAWRIATDDFSKITAPEWSGEPIDQSRYQPTRDQRYADLLKFREAYRNNKYTPHLKNNAPANFLRPACLRYVWEAYALEKLGDKTISDKQLLSFPMPLNAKGETGDVWREFVQTQMPLRYITIADNDVNQAKFTTFLQNRFKKVAYLNTILKSGHRDFSDIPLMKTLPEEPLGSVWMDFVRTQIPVKEWKIRDLLAEQAFQKFILAKYGSLAAVNSAYGINMKSINQLAVPFGDAVLITFKHHEGDLVWHGLTDNYVSTADFMFTRGKAAPNTLILVVLTMALTLIVNPLAGYALSRFKMRGSDKVLLFCLLTMAFPAAVTAIPGFLLLRDLGLLNTFWALVLPGAANGMAIFLLKGFFDSLPQELYEAAAIDGAPEWQVFWRISLPLVKPILAVNLLSAFLVAYNGWEWALIVCQNKEMWTLSVWTYQFAQTMQLQPYTVMAAFVLNSIPVLIVFLLCQKVILRGIILPEMK